jgi:hypothetical protein
MLAKLKQAFLKFCPKLSNEPFTTAHHLCLQNEYDFQKKGSISGSVNINISF